MVKKILDNRLLYALLAIIIATGLWFYVATTENSTGETTIRNIPVVFLNEELLEDSNLMISEGAAQTVSLTFMGSRSLLAELNQKRDELWVTVDVGRITSAGDQRMAYDISYPGTNSRFSNSLSVINREPNNIYFTVSNRVSKEIEVLGKFDGVLADGYMTGEFSIRPSTVVISGMESEVNQVSHALVTVSGEELDSTVSGEMGFDLISYQGEVLSGLNLTYSTETVSATLPVLQTADIPLEVEVRYGGGVPSDLYVDIKVEPETITVSGAREDLETLNRIVLGEIDLANIVNSETLTYPIPLDSALNNVSGITEAAVTVTIRGLVTRTMEAVDIQCINTPDGFEAVPVTQSLQVLVRGPEDAVNQLLDYNVRVVADLTDVSAAPGRYTVPARIYVGGTGEVGVVGNDYKIVVSIS